MSLFVIFLLRILLLLHGALERLSAYCDVVMIGRCVVEVNGQRNRFVHLHRHVFNFFTQEKTFAKLDKMDNLIFETEHKFVFL